MDRRHLLGLAAATLLGCRRRRSPEARVRALLARVEDAVEARDVAAVREALSPAFDGGDGLDRQGAMLMLQLQLRERRQVHVFSRVLDVDAAPGGPARVELLAAIAAVPIPGPEALANLDADIYRFKLVLAEDADGPEGYRVTSARWSPAELPEILGGSGSP
jgi:hypothetical protein